MIDQVQVATGFYVYSFLRSKDREAILSENLMGIEEAKITVIESGDLAVVVSPIVPKKIRPQRKFLAAHQEIVTTLAKSWSMLPVSFGLIADDLEQVHYILDKNRDILNEQLNRVGGNVEMTVALKWTAANIPQYFVDRYPELQAARALILEGRATREDQIEMGRVYESVLNAERATHTKVFMDKLSSISKELEVQPNRDDADVMRLACLIAREREEEFTAAVYQVAELFTDDFAITFNGPWPPYTFVKLALSME
ncbi:MAG: GvpL/GvpF family gas vesicle protein [Pirellula sp.]|jgi:hypothetical protein|nr:GvpL/GvpF family gas vesicle protein [Pirellula sp.]